MFVSVLSTVFIHQVSAPFVFNSAHSTYFSLLINSALIDFVNASGD